MKIDELFSKKSRDVFDWARSRGFSEQEADDIVQDTFLKTIEAAGDREIGEGYIVTAGVNQTIEAARKRRPVLSIDGLTGAYIPRKKNVYPERPVESKVLAAITIEERLSLLTDNQRDTAILISEGYRGHEVAGMLSVADSTVRTRLFRIREKMRQAV